MGLAFSNHNFSSRPWQKNYNLILAEEDSLARAVALGLWLKRPLSAWHYLLPGMFIFEFLRRSSMVKRYSEVFIYPRKLALDLALRMVKGEDRKQILTEGREIIAGWLKGVRLYSPKIQEKHVEQIDLLLNHYTRLLNAQGNSYRHLIRNTFLAKENYELFLKELTSREGKVDEAIAEFLGGTEQIWRRLRSEQEQVAFLRQKQAEEIFLEGE